MEKPILFNTQMVQAILQDKKTSTRRPIKLPDGLSGKPVFNPIGFMYPCGIKRPPYAVDDILWVRETWTSIKLKRPLKAIPMNFKDRIYLYKADNVENSDGSKIKWHPSIHMPRMAARLFLKVTDVRAERLQDITQIGAIDEGALTIPNTPEHQKAFDEAVKWGEKPPLGESPLERFIRTWDSCYNYPFSWNSNPWVWVIEFERYSV